MKKQDAILAAIESKRNKQVDIDKHTMEDDDFYSMLDDLPKEEEVTISKTISPPKSKKDDDGYAIDQSGRPETEEYLNGHLNLREPSYKVIVNKFCLYLNSVLPKFANAVYQADYLTLAESYKPLRSETGIIPKEYKLYTDLRTSANYMAVELFKIAKKSGRTMYSESMDELILELCGKIRTAVEIGNCFEFF